MSLIRTQPSAVGAFEAQVFDMGKTYRTITTQAAAQRKAQADAKKEMDKMMDNLAKYVTETEKLYTSKIDWVQKKLDDRTNKLLTELGNISGGSRHTRKQKRRHHSKHIEVAAVIVINYDSQDNIFLIITYHYQKSIPWPVYRLAN